MNYAHTIILAIILVTLFCCFFGWCLMRSCRRVIDAEMHELECQREECSTVKSARGASSKVNSKAGSKASSKANKASKAGGSGAK
ncbi:hypothetical protein COCVIDRAFT_87093 [Bipolaris victoriae FI3]|uniref:Uncharacterized protein n=1 Tax=Bipolaris victoriae (strain FI3) TaxID=930091 RepID=W7EMI2_BIPV3|nr:hypothetical protein COCVIDRAFT_87093 [Bipolaris victoriae FI3]